ncbi:MAG: PP2C family serine/threonine-protein phosphatase [Bacillota bacterium]|nr:PP2C family serine/threonine-protein phosphatase [Bacillota bacterium]
MTSKNDWKYTYASVLGSSHKKSHSPCQDSSKCQVIQDSNGEDILIAVISDGAGSAKFSDLGSSMACSLFVKEVTDYLSEEKRVKDLEVSFFENWIDQYQDLISSHARDFEVTLREFACTLVAAVVGNDHAAFFQVGDGAIVVLDPEAENYNWTFWPDKGEYENTTFFITDPKVKKHIRFDVLPKRVEEVSLFTDGIQHLSLHYQSKTVHNPFFKPIFQVLRKVENGEYLNSSLEQFLSSDRINEKTDDDKTLLLASRKEVEMNGND